MHYEADWRHMYQWKQLPRKSAHVMHRSLLLSGDYLHWSGATDQRQSLEDFPPVSKGTHLTGKVKVEEKEVPAWEVLTQ